MVENSKQVRVDNWGIFFLQRLQMFFSKTDYCDLTLQFEGNVQLKVHRLVMNACTEYFQFLEHTCPQIEENVIMMPADLQADVIVPIVNFMYTGMLEFHISIFDKLYKAAELMNITVLTKLLDAQKHPIVQTRASKRSQSASQSWNQHGKKAILKPTPAQPELPATLPGRKLPVWKRKNAPNQPLTHPSSHLNFAEQKWVPPSDPLSIPDNTPKPTRFEWPDDDLPTINLMDTSFDEISYTSKPLLTQEEEARASTSFDEIKHAPNNRAATFTKKQNSPGINMDEVKDYLKEQKIRTDLSAYDDEEEHDMEAYAELESSVTHGQKRKSEFKSKILSPKRIKLSEKENENSKETTISVTMKDTNVNELDHSKIVTEILKKYPQLVKKNKNIRLKIMASGPKSTNDTTKPHPPVRPPKLKVQVAANANRPNVETKITQISKPSVPEINKSGEGGPWTCPKCFERGDEQEFVLYYLYRKHMTDVHNEVFDSRLCKYCGQKCEKENLMMYHLHTKHAVKATGGYVFPKCDQCPVIALSNTALQKHKLNHGKNEMQCVECKLAFTSQQTLTSHLQITGHIGKTSKCSYDCQYCMKRLQSAINLFSHIKSQHRNEARRDGIVSIDDVVDADVEEVEEEQEHQIVEEYIVPEIMTEADVAKDKVKIISNVKVPLRQNQVDVGKTIHSEPSSEAEALSNVASGIATSLGLVDIVVLDENQQYILQQQQGQVGQPEFILPELGTGNGPFSPQVITTQHSTVLPQGMLHTSGHDIGSTDELVMVLTDHDYQEGTDTNTDNSNIVVLYSHPVDGQQGQFITSQGNLMVNSETGLLEIRNSASINAATTAANQLVMSQSSDGGHIESIEMIQREIENHNEMKQEPFYEEEKKPDICEKIEEEPQPQLEVPELVQRHQEPPESVEEESVIQERVDEAEDNQKTVEPNLLVDENQFVCEHNAEAETQHIEEDKTEDNEVLIQKGTIEDEQPLQRQEEQLDVPDDVNNQAVVEEEKSSDARPNNEDDDDEADGPRDVIEEEPMEIDEDVSPTLVAASENAPSESTSKLLVASEDPEPNEKCPSEFPADPGVDVPPDTANKHESREVEDAGENKSPDDTDLPTGSDDTDLPTVEEHAPESIEEQHPAAEFTTEAMEVDTGTKLQNNEKEPTPENPRETSDEPEDVEETHEDHSVPEYREENEVKDDSELAEEPHRDKNISSDADDLESSELEHRNVEVPEESNLTNNSEDHPDELSQPPSDFQHDECMYSEATTNSQFNDENSRSSEESQSSSKHETQKGDSQEGIPSTKISILDDWDDTDSQQSEQQKIAMKVAGETVNKLMDDWDEEEEEENKKTSDE